MNVSESVRVESDLSSFKTKIIWKYNLDVAKIFKGHDERASRW